MHFKTAKIMMQDRRTPQQKRIDRIRMNLRMFDEGSNGGDGSGDGDGEGEGDGDDDNEDDVQKKINAAVAAAIKKQDELWEKKFKQKFAAEKQKSSEAKRLAEMSEADKVNERIKALEDENAAMKANAARAEMATQVRSMLQAQNINVGDALINNLIGADADSTKEAVNTFAAEFKKAVNAAVKEQLKGKTPRAGSGNGTKGMTKEEIMKIKNPIERQNAIAANMDAFK